MNEINDSLNSSDLSKDLFETYFSNIITNDGFKISTAKKFAIKIIEKMVDINVKKGQLEREVSELDDLLSILTKINIIMTTIICAVGVIGNLLSLKVFSSTQFPNTSSRF
jgi:ascorbate-specific PTS system EIIC-type component UlaA